MDIENFLITWIIDVYEKYCTYALEMSEQDFDQGFYDEDGQEISDHDYLVINADSIFNEEVFDELYTIICDPGDGKEIPLKRFVSFLAGTYFVYNYYDGENSMIKFLKSATLEQIENWFVEKYDFGMDMLKSYFYGLVDAERCIDNREKIKENGDMDYLYKFFYQASVTNLVTLNDLLRNVICNLYNNYIKNGNSDIEALNCTWEYFLSNFDTLGELDQLGIDVETKELYKKYMLGIIMADLYEDVANGSIIDSINSKDRLADVAALISVTFGIIRIPADEELRNRMLKHFILLQDEKEKRRDNRKKTYDDKRIAVLRKVNPLYQLDELTFPK